MLKDFSAFSRLGILSPQKSWKRFGVVIITDAELCPNHSFVIVERAIQLRKNILASSGAVSRDYQLPCDLILIIGTDADQEHVCVCV